MSSAKVGLSRPMLGTSVVGGTTTGGTTTGGTTTGGTTTGGSTSGGSTTGGFCRPAGSREACDSCCCARHGFPACCARLLIAALAVSLGVRVLLILAVDQGLEGGLGIICCNRGLHRVTDGLAFGHAIARSPEERCEDVERRLRCVRTSIRSISKINPRSSA